MIQFWCEYSCIKFINNYYILELFFKKRGLIYLPIIFIDKNKRNHLFKLSTSIDAIPI